MTNSEFKGFRAQVEKADRNADIWWCGYYWLDLTKRQGAIIDQILSGKGFIDQEIRGTVNGTYIFHKLPSGICWRAC